MQQRAPLFKGKRNDFVNFLSEFTQNEGFKEITVRHSWSIPQIKSFSKFF